MTGKIRVSLQQPLFLIFARCYRHEIIEFEIFEDFHFSQEISESICYYRREGLKLTEPL